MKPFIRRVSLPAILYSLPMLWILESSAATFSCLATDSGFCISDAILSSLENDEPDIIELGAGTHRHAPSRRYDGVGSNCFPPINSDITITGKGMDETLIIARRDGTSNCRAFLITEEGSLTLQALTITEGATEYSISGDILDPTIGAGIYNKGTLVVDQSSLTKNWALTAGGGIYNAPNAKAALQNCKIVGNIVAESHIRTAGSAIFNEGEMTIDACEVTGNFSGEDYAYAISNGLHTSEYDAIMEISNSLISRNRGGGIAIGEGRNNLSAVTVTKSTISYNFGGGITNVGGGKAVIVDSTIAHNVSAVKGGGISHFNYHSVPETILINSTVSGNLAMGLASPIGGEPYPGAGGGIYSSVGKIVLANSTVTDNRSISGAGGISLDSTYSSAVIRNSIIAGNKSEQAGMDDCADEGTAAGFVFEGTNLTGLNTGCPSDSAPTYSISYEQIFKTLIGPLQDNGGPTQTHALIPLSPAIDAAVSGCRDPDGNVIGFDQRGMPREECDVGAYELQYETVIVDLRLLGPFDHFFYKPGSRTKLWIVVLSNDEHDPAFRPASEINVDTLYAGDGATANKISKKDINHDGYDDLLLEFKAHELGLKCGDGTVILNGYTNSDSPILGSLSVTTVGCKNRNHRKGDKIGHR